MDTIDILRWDVVENPCTNTLRPMIYFTPSLKLLDYLSSNQNNKIIVDLTNVDGPYNSQNLVATHDISKWIPNCRSNFYAATGAHVLILDEVIWNGWPSGNLGLINISHTIFK